MRILLVNKFYYPRGGDCIYTVELEKLLKENGHEVAVFSMQHPQNIRTQWERYFPNEVDFSKPDKKRIIDIVVRPLGSREVKGKFQQLLSDFKPDIVHLNNIHTQLSPIVAKIAHAKGIKVIWTLHDYKLLCPRYDCLRNDKYICELCFVNNRNVLKYSCMKNNKLASVLSYLEAIRWKRSEMIKYTDKFICPSRFLANKMIQGGCETSKLQVLHNFINASKIDFQQILSDRDDYYCYVGRISHEKGVETLLQAAIKLPYKLKVIGGGPLFDEFSEKYKDDRIEFMGYQNWDSIKEIVGTARFMVIPSECYENNPLSVIESLSLGTPVLGANIAGIPELIQEGKNGLLFESGNVDDLRKKIKTLYQQTTENLFNNQQIAEDSQINFSASKYYEQLMTIYNQR